MVEEKHKLPCHECLIFSMCQNRDPLDLIRDCELIYNHLHKSSKTLIQERLQAFCNILGRTLIKSGGEYHISRKD